MSKKISEDVFRLVKSLRPAEKRYFHLQWAGRKEASKYLQLFELLCQMEHYDESVILNFREGLFSAQQLPNLKAHLYHRLLQSLRLYAAAATSSDLQIREQIDHAQLLFQRGLPQQCHQMLKKAKKMALRHDHLELQLEILKWEQYLLPYLMGKHNEKRFRQLLQEASLTTQRLNQVLSLNKALLQLNKEYLRTGFIRHRDDLLRIEKLFEGLQLDIPEAQLSFNGKIAYYQLYVGYFAFRQDFERCYEYARRWVRLFQDNEEFIPTHFEMYLKGLNYLLTSQERLYKYKELLQSQKRLRQLWKQPPLALTQNLELRLFKYIYVHEFNRLFMMGDFEKGVKLMSKIKKDLEYFVTQLDKHSQLILYYKIACLYFGNADYAEANLWLNRIIGLPATDLREDVHSFARILHLVCHYEMGNTDILDHYIRSTYRFLLKKQDYYLFQKYILEFLKALVALPDSGLALKRQFRKLYEQLLPLQQHPFEKRAFLYFDIIAWLEAKASGRSVSRVIQEKFQQRLGEKLES
jgi:hypothetical protein